MSATPRPWLLTDSRNGSKIHTEQRIIADVCLRGDADLIIQAVNAHDALVAALRLCDPDGLRAAKIHAPEDAEVEALCERIGYGAVMDAAARLWRRKDPLGAHTTGPAAGTVRAALKLADVVSGPAGAADEGQG